MARSRASRRAAPTRGAAPSARPAAGPVDRRRAAPSLPRWWAPAVALAAFAVYANSLDGALIYDDVNAIRNNPFVRTGDVAGILTQPSWWGIARGPLWRPLTTLSFALDHAVHGLAPFGYHLVNVLLHAGVSVLVLRVFALAARAPRTAFAAGLLFATHPVHSEAVASVVGRAEVIAAGGFFAAWWCWLAAASARGTARAAWSIATVVAYFLAMCGKENAVMLPVVLLFAHLLGPDGEPAAVRVRRRLPEYVALGATALVFVGLRAAVLGQIAPRPDLLDNPLGTLPLASRLPTAIAVVGLYALRLILPWQLSADYSYDQVSAVTSAFDPRFLGGLAVLVAVPVVVWWAWRRLPPLALGLGTFALTFLLVANLVFLIGTIMGERLIYLPSAGFCLALGAGLVRLGGDGDVAGRMPARWTPAVVLPLALVVALFGVRTVARNRVWHDPFAFFTAMVADAPRSARSQRELATVLAEGGRFAEAHQSFERSLAIKPGDATTLYNFGNALSHEGRFDDAVAAYGQAVAAKPDFVEALENLGNAESARGNQQAALDALRRALVLTPTSPMLLMNLANTLFRVGDVAAARATYERALEHAPQAPEILTNYGSFLYAQADYAAAARVLERMPDPAPARALVMLAASYRAQGLAAQAAAVQARAERLHPNDGGVRQMAETLRRDGAARAGSP